MNEDYKSSFFESIGTIQSVCFVAFAGIVLVAAISLFRSTVNRSQISITLAIFAIAIFFYAGALEHLGLLRHHWSNSISGGSDPIALEQAYAKFYTKLHAFRSLSVLGLLISALGYLAATLTDRANKAE